MKFFSFGVTSMAPSKNIDGKQGAVTKLQFYPCFCSLCCILLLVVLLAAALLIVWGPFPHYFFFLF